MKIATEEYLEIKDITKSILFPSSEYTESLNVADISISLYTKGLLNDNTVLSTSSLSSLRIDKLTY